MAPEMQKTSMFIEQNPGDYENGDIRKNLDDDGRAKRTGSYLFPPLKCLYPSLHVFLFSFICKFLLMLALVFGLKGLGLLQVLILLLL